MPLINWLLLVGKVSPQLRPYLQGKKLHISYRFPITCKERMLIRIIV